jgi:hypothetical protein
MRSRSARRSTPRRGSTHLLELHGRASTPTPALKRITCPPARSTSDLSIWARCATEAVRVTSHGSTPP